ncbi:alpha/beta hydrolase [Sphingomonas canadensis]|uniref:Alpha/beta hydrolase n=1 Tax=Sphingomonas canadensis TaxID=1219257 RepID=A0ABW3H3H4_9SPHN|nr:alpha/beta hydrolase [Sphingomonas canadensis]MCW3834668.1 alpha/beta hydrolase [Sphingomonas canadensis]
MPYALSADVRDLPVLTIFDRSDPPARDLIAKGAMLLEIEGGCGRNRWAARLDEAVRLADRPAVLVAHGIGCFAVAWWARLSPASYVAQVAGAVFVRPLASAISASPEQRFDGPHTPLPFAATLIEDAPGAEELAANWGCALVPPAGAPAIPALVRMLAGADTSGAANTQAAPVLELRA